MIGMVSTALNLGLLAVLIAPLGTQVGNLVALLASTLFNTAANRAWTFQVRGREGMVRHHAQSLLLFGMTWAVTAGALALVGHVSPHASTEVQVLAVAIANLVATVVRFLAMKIVIFRTAD